MSTGNDDDRCYDCIIVGAGLSGLQTARSLIDDHGLDSNDILILEAQDYIGGRVKQNTDFIKNVKIDLGAEIIHGDNTMLTKLAKKANESIIPSYCWAHGDGGPFESAVNGLYGLYYVGSGDNKRLLRFDDKDPEFCRLNQVLKDLGSIDENTVDDECSLQDYLESQGFSNDMIGLAAAGFSNTFCSVNEQMSFKQAVRYTRLWHSEEDDEGEFRFRNSYACVIDYLKKGIKVKLNTPVALIDNTEGYMEEQIALQHRDDSPTPSVVSDSERELVKVITKDGTIYHTRSVVVTSSPKVLLSDLIKFNPPLPEHKLKGLQSIDMHRAMKIVLKFKKRAWPKKLQGMIMGCDDCVVPEMWFRDITSLTNNDIEKIIPGSDSTADNNDDIDGEATCIASAFATAKFADRLMAMSEEAMYHAVLSQMDEVLSKLNREHMSANPSDEDENPENLPLPSSVFIKAMHHDWKKFPYIGGGYSCAHIGWNVSKGSAVAESIDVGRSGAIFFAGEATNVTQPGGTAHAALETGGRAADEVSAYLDLYFD